MIDGQFLTDMVTRLDSWLRLPRKFHILTQDCEPHANPLSRAHLSPRTLIPRPAA